MALSPEEVRLASFAMAAAYAAMGYGFFRPAWNRRVREAAPVRASREVPELIDLLWVGTQGWVMLALLLGLFAPTGFGVSPFSLLAHSDAQVAALGAAVMVAGCALVAWAARELGAELAVRIEVREGGRLVASGPYARVRHPIYTGVFLIVFGLAVALAAPLLAGYGAIAVACARLRALAEEELFSNDAIHGDAYRRYMTQTGRFLPKVFSPRR